LRIKKIIKGTGKIFPVMHTKVTAKIGSSNRTTPIGIVVAGPPTPGNNEIRNTIRNLAKFVSPKIPCKNSRIDSANYDHPFRFTLSHNTTT